VPSVEPPAAVDLLEEPPDVLDVRVRKREVAVRPVHPHPEAAGLVGDHAGEARNPLLAAVGELSDSVLLDVPLRVQPEGLLDLHFDPEPLAVEPILVPLLEAAQCLVALEDVLQRAAPRVVDAHRSVRRDRPVEEAPPRSVGVLLAKPIEDPLSVPPLEDPPLNCRMIGD